MINDNQIILAGECTKAQKRSISGGKSELVSVTINGVQATCFSDAGELPPAENLIGKTLQLTGWLETYEPAGKDTQYQLKFYSNNLLLSEKSLLEPVNLAIISGVVTKQDGDRVEISSTYMSRDRETKKPVFKDRHILLDLAEWSSRSGISADKMKPGKSNVFVTGELFSENWQVMVKATCLNPANYTKISQK